MKLDPIFTVSNNKLFTISDKTPVDISTLKRTEILWSTVEMEEESYNEEYLANLREQLKPLDEINKFVILVPVVDKPLETSEQIELFINAYNHTARRIKDCTCIAGFELPSSILKFGLADNSAAIEFMETVAKKHAQYVYFASQSDVTNYNLLKDMQNLPIVIN